MPFESAGPMMRLHIGLEDPADLIADLAQGFERFHAASDSAASARRAGE